MILDGHIHIEYGEVDREHLENQMQSVGITGGIVLSLPPASFYHDKRAYTSEERLKNLFLWVGDNTHLYPFYWIDPMEEDALQQVEMAYNSGVKGFKIICSYFYPGDKRALCVYKAIARKNRPVLFHSGILWNGQASSKYNRPAEFEALMEIEGLRFTLAHISWPWYDENIAVYGKIQHALSSRRELSSEMYVDLTPGTPLIYREDALTKLFTVGYNIEDNVFFGTDCKTNKYNSDLAAVWIKRDNEIYEKLGLSKNIREKIYWRNLMRFIEGKMC